MTQIKLLTFSTLYPNAVQPYHGIFVEHRLRHLLTSGRVESHVVAPVPWFPVAASAFGKYAGYAATPKAEQRHGIRVSHPRYPLIPKVGMTLAPLCLALGALPTLRRLRREGYDFSVIDAHYFYPDGVAAVLLGRYLDLPVTITARGTDVNLIPEFRLPRAMIKWAARQAKGVITVCQALKDELVEMGVDESKVQTLRNGVDLELFSPGDRQALRAELKLERTTLLSVGHLITRKGHDLVIRSLEQLPDVDLMVVGSGEEEAALKALTESLGLSSRVRFVSAVEQQELVKYYNAADILVLASSREGWANVLLEAMACGTPVVASRVWGTPEVVREPEAGLLAAERTPDAFAQGARQLLENYPDRAATRRYAEQFSWDDTTEGQLKLFEALATECKAA